MCDMRSINEKKIVSKCLDSSYETFTFKTWFCTLMVLAPLVPVMYRNTILSYGIRSIFSSFLVQWEQLRFVVTISSFLALSPLSVILLNPRNNLPLPARDNGSILKHLKSQHPVFTYLRDPYL